MYDFLLLVHNYTRWVVVIALAWALFEGWRGLITRRKWDVGAERSGSFFANATSVQFLVGLALYMDPSGLVRSSFTNLGEAMSSRELRFFIVEHPLLMFVAVGLAHLGNTRSKKTEKLDLKWRWAAACYTFAAIAIFYAIPWGRPLLRLP